MELMLDIRSVVFTILGILTYYKTIYLIVGLLVKAKVFEKAPQTKKYGIVIAARNEDKVIGLLVDSLHKQTYPRDLYRVFVVADNCTDRTAEIARERGATVYERHCPEKARKGWALEFLFENIEKDYGIQSFDGYLFFDADNVVSSDYLEQMNNAFATGVDGVIGYRNTKNFDRNLISAHYGIHFMRSSMSLHRPRSRMGLGTHIAGTGYLLSSEMLKDGWHYSCLTEDTQATMDFVVRGKRIEYCEAAEFYDEQPYQIKVMVRQRIRWAKGRMACFFAYGHRLVTGVFKHHNNTAPARRQKSREPIKKEDISNEKLTFLEKTVLVISRFMDICGSICDAFARFFRPISKNFSCFDMIFYLFPTSFFYRMVYIGFFIAEFYIGWMAGSLFTDGVLPWVGSLIQLLCGHLSTYISNVFRGFIIVLREWKHIHCSKPKMAFYLITWPLHDMIYPYLCLASLFMRVKWKPIKHDEAISLEEIKSKTK